MELSPDAFEMATALAHWAQDHWMEKYSLKGWIRQEFRGLFVRRFLLFLLFWLPVERI